MNNGVIYGLTGGIATGKSTVAKMFSQLGVPCVDADRVAREVVAPGTPGLKEVVAKFGPRVLLPDGTLNRTALADIVFGDPKARTDLNQIMHPRIAMESARQCNELTKHNPYVLYEAALLVETQQQDRFHGLIVTTAPEEIQRARLAARNQLSTQEIEARLNAQITNDERIALADHVIHTDTSPQETERQVHEVHRQIVEHLQ